MNRNEKLAYTANIISLAKGVASNPAFLFGHVRMFGGRYEKIDNRLTHCTKKGPGRKNKGKVQA